MRIVIETIPHSEQRYDTVGDWQFKLGTNDINAPDLHIKVSRVHHSAGLDFEFLVAIHELVEAYCCFRFGKSEAAVDAFDTAWKPHDGIEEPGDDPAAPYHLQHMFASVVERMVACALRIEWAEYAKALTALDYQPKEYHNRKVHCGICVKTLEASSEHPFELKGLSCDRQDCPGRYKS